jgi:hypothetical protein
MVMQAVTTARVLRSSGADFGLVNMAGAACRRCNVRVSYCGSWDLAAEVTLRLDNRKKPEARAVWAPASVVQ